METCDREPAAGLAALRAAVLQALCPGLQVAAGPTPVPDGWLLADTVGVGRPRSRFGSRPVAATAPGRPPAVPPVIRPAVLAAGSPAAVEAEATRLVALVDLARGGDSEAFGLLYDHYHGSIYRFVYYRVRSVPLAEDLTSETFLRALRSIRTFHWQGKDFGAWLTTIARNLARDHFKAGRTRLERSTDDLAAYDASTEGPESTVLTALTHRALLAALTELPHEQQECLIMRFLQGLSIAETARVLGRSDGAVKQLQLRGVRNLASRMSGERRCDP